MPIDNDDRDARRAKVAAAAPRESKLRPVLIVVVVLALLIGAGGAIWYGVRSTSDEQAGGSNDQVYPQGATGPGGGIVVDAAKAKSGAPRLDIYEDFQCPVCKEAEKELGPTITKMSTNGEAQVVYHMKSFLDETFKANGIPTPNPDSSPRSAAAAACAADAGKFEQYHDTVFAHQPANEGGGYTDAQLEQFAQEAGITGTPLTTWKSCYSSKKYAGYVKLLEEQTARAGVNSTPTFQVNGKKFDLTEQKISSAEDFRTKVLAAAGVSATTGATTPATGATSK